MLSDLSEASLCTGCPPQAKPGNPRKMTYFIGKQKGGRAAFVSVLEPYEDESFIAESKLISQTVESVVVKVSHKNGRVDFVCINRMKDTLPVNTDGYDFTVSGFLNVLSFLDGALVFKKTYGAENLSGTICDFTKDLCSDNYLTVQLYSDSTVPVGKYIDIETDAKPNAFFKLTSAESLGENKWKLGVGDCSLITGFVDREAKDKGYTYVIREGSACTITL